MNPEDVPMNLALMRFSLVDGSFLMEPGCSMFMRNNKSEWFIDTDCDTLEGRIYISKQEFVDMAKLVGYVPIADINGVLATNRVLEEHNEHLCRTISTLRRALSDSLLVDVPGEDSTQELPDANTGNSGDIKLSINSSNGDKKASHRVDGPSDGEESNGISGDSDNGEPDSLLP